jgi:alpha/beta superfamily hydrolase
MVSYSGGGAVGTWTAGMRREATGRVAMAAMTGAALDLAPASAKVLKGEDDDDDVGVTRGGPHLAVRDGRRAVGGQARADG